VEFLLYRDFHDLVQICIKVEQQILIKGLQISYYSDSYLKRDYPRESKTIKGKSKENPSPSVVQEKYEKKDGHITSTRTNDIKYFKCLGLGHVKAQCPL